MANIAGWMTYKQSSVKQYEHTMDQRKACQDPNTPQEPGEAEQEQQQQEPEESPFNQDQQDNQVNCSLPHTQLQLNSGQTQEIKEQQVQVNHEPNVQQNQDPQCQENQKHQTYADKNQQTQPGQEVQTRSGQTLKSQQMSISYHPTQPLSAPEQCQKKQSNRNQQQAKNQNPTEKKSAQWHKEQQLKKRKKKLVGENQERINYLVQASRAIGLTAESSASLQSQRALAAQLGSLAGAVGRRCVLRLAPALKRCLCKGCGTSLVYSVNAKVRHRSRRQKHLVVTCLTCHTIKRFINNPRHQLWFEQEEAVV